MKTFIIGDIHGGNKALEQVLERSDFNTEEYWQSDLVKELYPNEKGR